MGNVIATVRSTGSGYWAAYVGGEKIKTDGINNTPEPMSLPINDLSFSDGQKRKPEFAALFYFSLQK